MIAQGAMAFNSLRWPHADPYGVPQILVALKSFPHFLTVLGGRQAMTARSKVLRNRTIRGEESLGLSW